MTEQFRPCAVMPSHNHWRDAAAVVNRLRSLGLPVFIVDDASSEPARSVLSSLARHSGGGLHRLGVNQGKGGAVMQGMRMAIDAGYTHAVQVDADGQHDLEALPALLKLARDNQNALVMGTPVYDRSIPLGRSIGRRITHFWVWIETVFSRIPDTMCGFRVYPLAAMAALLNSRERLGRRMDFDIEVAVRLFWRGTPLVPIPVRVTYPTGNTSNFRMLRDNLRISGMHTRLVITLVLRLPRILRERAKPQEQTRGWAMLGERGLYAGLRASALIYRLLGRRGCMAVLAPVVLYFYLTGRTQRRASRDFLTRAFAAKGWRAPGWRDGFRHFRSFAACALDSFIAWTGGLRADDFIRELVGGLWGDIEASKRGALFVVSHVGNAELSRAMIDPAIRDRLLVLVHTRHAENYNRLLRRFRPASAINCLQVTELGPEAAIALKDRIDRGDWVVIAGDRTPVSSGGRTVAVPFLGALAPFSVGPYILAALLECPVYTLFCMREGKRYRVEIAPLAAKIELPRKRREAALQCHAKAFAAQLEAYALRDPYQWYNFFDFWAERKTQPGT